MIGVGDRFPEVTLPDQDGKAVTIPQPERNLVVFFYPADHTPGCTKEACSFRDEYEAFRAADAEVIGISRDDGDEHRSFIAKHSLPFPLLSDAGGKVAAEVGVPKTLGILAGRVTFVVGRDGVVRHVFKNQLQAARHVPEALEALRRITV